VLWPLCGRNRVSANDPEVAASTTTLTLSEEYALFWDAQHPGPVGMCSWTSLQPAPMTTYMVQMDELARTVKTIAEKGASKATQEFNSTPSQGWTPLRSTKPDVRAEAMPYSNMHGGGIQVTIQTRVYMTYQQGIISDTQHTPPYKKTRTAAASAIIAELVGKHFAAEVDQTLQAAAERNNGKFLNVDFERLTRGRSATVEPAEALYCKEAHAAYAEEDSYYFLVSQCVTIVPDDALVNRLVTAARFATYAGVSTLVALPTLFVANEYIRLAEENPGLTVGQNLGAACHSPLHEIEQLLSAEWVETFLGVVTVATLGLLTFIKLYKPKDRVLMSITNSAMSKVFFFVFRLSTFTAGHSVEINESSNDDNVAVDNPSQAEETMNYNEFKHSTVVPIENSKLDKMSAEEKGILKPQIGNKVAIVCFPEPNDDTTSKEAQDTMKAYLGISPVMELSENTDDFELVERSESTKAFRMPWVRKLKKADLDDDGAIAINDMFVEMALDAKVVVVDLVTLQSSELIAKQAEENEKLKPFMGINPRSFLPRFQINVVPLTPELKVPYRPEYYTTWDSVIEYAEANDEMNEADVYALKAIRDLRLPKGIEQCYDVYAIPGENVLSFEFVGPFDAVLNVDYAFFRGRIKILNVDNGDIDDDVSDSDIEVVDDDDVDDDDDDDDEAILGMKPNFDIDKVVFEEEVAQNDGNFGQDVFPSQQHKQLSEDELMDRGRFFERFITKNDAITTREYSVDTFLEMAKQVNPIQFLKCASEYCDDYSNLEALFMLLYAKTEDGAIMLEADEHRGLYGNHLRLKVSPDQNVTRPVVFVEVNLREDLIYAKEVLRKMNDGVNIKSLVDNARDVRDRLKIFEAKYQNPNALDQRLIRESKSYLQKWKAVKAERKGEADFIGFDYRGPEAAYGSYMKHEKHEAPIRKAFKSMFAVLRNQALWAPHQVVFDAEGVIELFDDLERTLPFGEFNGQVKIAIEKGRKAMDELLCKYDVENNDHYGDMNVAAEDQPVKSRMERYDHPLEFYENVVGPEDKEFSNLFFPSRVAEDMKSRTEDDKRRRRKIIKDVRLGKAVLSTPNYDPELLQWIMNDNTEEGAAYSVNSPVDLVAALNKQHDDCMLFQQVFKDIYAHHRNGRDKLVEMHLVGLPDGPKELQLKVKGDGDKTVPDNASFVGFVKVNAKEGLYMAINILNESEHVPLDELIDAAVLVRERLANFKMFYDMQQNDSNYENLELVKKANEALNYALHRKEQREAEGYFLGFDYRDRSDDEIYANMPDELKRDVWDKFERLFKVLRKPRDASMLPEAKLVRDAFKVIAEKVHSIENIDKDMKNAIEHSQKAIDHAILMEPEVNVAGNAVRTPGGIDASVYRDRRNRDRSQPRKAAKAEKAGVAQAEEAGGGDHVALIGTGVQKLNRIVDNVESQQQSRADDVKAAEGLLKDGIDEFDRALAAEGGITNATRTVTVRGVYNVAKSAKTKLKKADEAIQAVGFDGNDLLMRSVNLDDYIVWCDELLVRLDNRLRTPPPPTPAIVQATPAPTPEPVVQQQQTPAAPTPAAPTPAIVQATPAAPTPAAPTPAAPQQQAPTAPTPAAPTPAAPQQQTAPPQQPDDKEEGGTFDSSWWWATHACGWILIMDICYFADFMKRTAQGQTFQRIVVKKRCENNWKNRFVVHTMPYIEKLGQVMLICVVFGTQAVAVHTYLDWVPKWLVYAVRAAFFTGSFVLRCMEARHGNRLLYIPYENREKKQD
jgi:hypothetical protein